MGYVSRYDTCVYIHIWMYLSLYLYIICAYIKHLQCFLLIASI